MIKSNYTLIQQNKNVFKIYEQQLQEYTEHQGTHKSEQSINKKLSTNVGVLAEETVGCCYWKNTYKYENLQLKLYDQIVTVANTNTQGRWCWRCSNKLMVTNSQRVIIGTIERSGCFGRPMIKISESQGNLALVIVSQCCQIGNLIPDCLGFLRCNSQVLYEIENIEREKVGRIVNKPNKSCGISHKFSLEVSEEIGLKNKLLLINSIALIL